MTGVTEETPTVTRYVEAPPSDVWATLADGWLYPVWVVGAARMRDVDADWPAKGSCLHHSVGNWPVLLDDKTEVLDVEHERLLRLQAHGWPAGSAEVLIELRPKGTGTDVDIREDALSGPATLVPPVLRHAAMVPRNRESLKRLAYIAEHKRSA